jgi:hypothetical protein
LGLGTAAYFFDLDVALSGFGLDVGFAWSPKTFFRGQILKAGHFLQPATTAIGQSVISRSSLFG